MAPSSASPPNKVVLILGGAGLKMGKDGLIDCYDRGNSTQRIGEKSNDPRMKYYRPDIVHQCLLAAYDSLYAINGSSATGSQTNDSLVVLIVTIEGIIIELSPSLRPPRTYNRFKGLIETLFREGVIKSKEGSHTLMKKVNNQQNSSTTSTLAPYIPYGARVIGLSNTPHAAMKTPVMHATEMMKNPVDNNLQGGLRSVGTDKNVYGFYVIACNDQAELFPSSSNSMMYADADAMSSGENFYSLFVSEELALSPLPTTPHLLVLRLLEGYWMASQTGHKDAVDGLIKRTTSIDQSSRPTGNQIRALNVNARLPNAPKENFYMQHSQTEAKDAARESHPKLKLPSGNKFQARATETAESARAPSDTSNDKLTQGIGRMRKDMKRARN